MKLSLKSAPLFIGLLLFVLTACDSPQEASSETSQAPSEAPLPEEQPESSSEIPFVQAAETAHKLNSFRQQEVLVSELELEFGGRIRFQGTMSILTSTGKIRLDHNDGHSVIFDGEQVWLSPDSFADPGARFDIFTWSYFQALPYKLSDGGTIWSDVPFNSLQGKTYDSKKLNFTEGTGDSSLDWYIVYTDPQSHLIEAAAYIVTFSQGQEEAEEDPHAITYHNYQDVEGIPMATEWKFWTWREDEGLTDQLGRANLANVRFESLSPEMFTAPEGGKEIPYERPDA